MREVAVSPTAQLLTRSEFLATFASDVRAHLKGVPRQLPFKYLYDDLGSALFEAICRLPWYKITRAESLLLSRHAGEIFQPLSEPLTLAELGCGSGEKLALAVRALQRPPAVQLIDISETALEAATERLRSAGITSIETHQSTYEEGIAHLPRRRGDDGAFAVLFLGSNVGNFPPLQAREFLSRIRTSLRDGDALLVGADLIKPERDLLLAYDDPLGVTAAFNRNLLRRINDELGGTFDLDGFSHRAIWNPHERRVEMYLVSLHHQRVSIEAAELDLTFEAGEPIWTESSYKYEPEDLVREGLAAGFDRGDQWIEESAGFALTRFMV
jgi:dimethylhistidine N-methyltransferase